MAENNQSIFDMIHQYGPYVGMGIIGIAVLLVLLYYMRLATLKDFKQKYDYINKHEIDTLWRSTVILLIGAIVWINALFGETELLWLSVKVFVSAMLGLIIGVIIQNILRFYYPFHIEKRLKKLRYTPRISPKTGKPMKLLTEEEEDVYLDEGMQAEEDIFSVDYDVWVDEETGYTKIEKYSGHLHALQCSECNYQTLKVVKEEIIKSPTITEEGELMKYFKCSYCGHKARKTFHIAKLKEATDLSETPNVQSTP
ncbi:hypothetical protein JKA74_15665 [Marivirga sp. S37H4]|uniref:Uncharacterized protein n=1 Tax=Marivirga aurantiaca TaxID=2802615 RepID=A0A934X110_9BACT|nr:hypothetical protein [Marivirga aurantiaca]MBK6266482.1 hypothetical protein [Marivirga aurantiaca]